jgi:hypothetical protein
MTIARYDVNNANVNREVRFHIERDAGPVANTFLSLKGPANVYPFYNQIAGVPTVEQELGQLRLNLVARAISVYTITVALQVRDTGGETNSGLDWVVEQDEMGAYFNQQLPPLAAAPGVPGVDTSWPVQGNAVDKHHVAPIIDRLGTGGMPLGPKTKPGLQLLLDSLGTVSFDGGTTGPFGDLSDGGSIVLPDGRVVTTGVAAPALPDGAGAFSGLTITWVDVG